MAIKSSKEIGQKLRQFRMAEGLTQEELAVKIDVTFQQVQKYESGENRLNTDNLQVVAEILGVPVTAFFDDADAISIASESEQQILENLRNIKNKGLKDALITVIGGIRKK